MKKQKSFMLFVVSIKNLKPPKISQILERTLVIKNIERRRINWSIINFWFNWKYVTALNIWLKRTQAKNLDWKI